MIQGTVSISKPEKIRRLLNKSGWSQAKLAREATKLFKENRTTECSVYAVLNLNKHVSEEKMDRMIATLEKVVTLSEAK